MNIDVKNIVNGSLNGTKVWICDYKYPDLRTTNPLRNIPPVQVLIQDNSQTTKNIYYSDSHFVVIKNGKPTKKIHAIFDNTGYRSFTGNPVYVFDNQEECEAKYAELLSAMIDRWIAYKNAAIVECDARIAECNRIIKKV